MSFFDKLISGIGLKRIKEQITKPTTGDLRASRFALHVNNVVDLPRFTIWTAMQMRTDPVVQFGLHIRDALISPSDVEFETKNPELGEWLRKQWDVIWGKNWFKITQAKQWGYQGLEVLMKEDETTGFIDVIGLRDFSPFDARALSSEGETVGLRIRGHVRNAGAAGQGRLLMPQALWVPFASRWGNPYGWSIMRGAHSPWWEKWMTGGVKKVTQIRMIKDGYRGLMGRYPLDGKVTTDDGTELSWRDIIREVLENMNAAASVVLPSILDADGNQLLDIVPQPEAPDPKAIFEWGSRVDREIWFAQDVPQEIIEAASTGSGFSGRSIPFVVALQLIGGREFGSYMEAIDRMTLRPLAQLNFGNGAASEYKITPKSLPEIFAEMLGGSQMGGQAIGGQPGQAPQGGPGVPPGEPTSGQPPQPVDGEGGREVAASKEPAGEFIDRKLADGRVVKVRNPNFKGGQFAELPIEKQEDILSQFAEFDESKQPRKSKGSPEGGQFGKGGGERKTFEAMDNSALNEIRTTNESKNLRSLARNILKSRGVLQGLRSPEELEQQRLSEGKGRVFVDPKPTVAESDLEEWQEVNDVLEEAGAVANNQSESGSTYYTMANGRQVRVSNHSPNAATANWIKENNVVDIRLGDGSALATIDQLQSSAQFADFDESKVKRDPKGSTTG